MNKFIYQRIRKWLGTLTIPDTIKYIPLRSSPCLAIVSPASNIWMRAAEVMKSTASDGIPSSHTTLRSNSVGFCGEMEAGALSCRFIFTSTSCEPKQRRSREYNEVIYLLFSSHNEWSFPLGTGKRLLYFLWRGRAKYSVNFKALYTSISTIFLRRSDYVALFYNTTQSYYLPMFFNKRHW